MAKVYLNDYELTNIGNAIRAKTGGTSLLLPSEMPEAIASITSGGSGGEGDYIVVDGREITKEVLLSDYCGKYEVPNFSVSKSKISIIPTLDTSTNFYESYFDLSPYITDYRRPFIFETLVSEVEGEFSEVFWDNIWINGLLLDDTKSPNYVMAHNRYYKMSPTMLGQSNNININSSIDKFLFYKFYTVKSTIDFADNLGTKMAYTNKGFRFYRDFITPSNYRKKDPAGNYGHLILPLSYYNVQPSTFALKAESQNNMYYFKKENDKGFCYYASQIIPIDMDGVIPITEDEYNEYIASRTSEIDIEEPTKEEIIKEKETQVAALLHEIYQLEHSDSNSDDN